MLTTGQSSNRMPLTSNPEPAARFSAWVMPKHLLLELVEGFGPQPWVMVRPCMTGPLLLRTATATELKGVAEFPVTTVASLKLPLVHREPEARSWACGPKAMSSRVVLVVSKYEQLAGFLTP